MNQDDVAVYSPEVTAAHSVNSFSDSRSRSLWSFVSARLLLSIQLSKFGWPDFDGGEEKNNNTVFFPEGNSRDSEQQQQQLIRSHEKPFRDDVDQAPLAE